jgi:hypothetical protein
MKLSKRLAKTTETLSMFISFSHLFVYGWWQSLINLSESGIGKRLANNGIFMKVKVDSIGHRTPWKLEFGADIQNGQQLSGEDSV